MENFSEFIGRYQDGLAAAFSGIGTTLYVTGGALVIGVFLGLIMALAKMSKYRILRWIANIYIEIIRGTPLFVQMLILAYGVPTLISGIVSSLTGAPFQFNWNPIVIVGVIACGINSGAYQAEIIRSGIQAINKGQVEASRSLGMSGNQTMRYIVLPQAFRVIMPALANEFVTLIKETSILSYIGIVEITRNGQLLSSRTFQPFSAFISVAIIYMCMTIPLSRWVAYMEARMGSSNGGRKHKRSRKGNSTILNV